MRKPVIKIISIKGSKSQVFNKIKELSDKFGYLTLGEIVDNPDIIKGG